MNQTAAKITDKDSEKKIQGPERILAAPRTRKLARSLKFRLSLFNGTGRLGRITDQDVEAFSKNKGQADAGSSDDIIVAEPAAFC